MEIRCYLCVSERGSVHATKRRPALADDEVAIEINLSLAAGLFQRPQLRATLDLSGVKPIEIDAEILSDIEDAIAETLQLPLRVEVVTAEERTADGG